MGEFCNFTAPRAPDWMKVPAAHGHGVVGTGFHLGHFHATYVAPFHTFHHRLQDKDQWEKMEKISQPSLQCRDGKIQSPNLLSRHSIHVRAEWPEHLTAPSGENGL